MCAGIRRTDNGPSRSALLQPFPHEGVLYNVDSGIKEPKDFEGKRLGTRTYTVTPGTIHKGILKEEYGVDLDSITWVAAEPEHVEQTTPHLPKNVIPGTGETGNDLFDRLVSGDLQAGIAGVNPNNREAPNVRLMFPNATELDKAFYQRTGVILPFAVPVIKTFTARRKQGAGRGSPRCIRRVQT